ncbi:MAG: NAD(+) diphosphatase [Bacteroidaceae bacterium]|nr:NAD(+) diphosphatase [Bacteroidaceae bacterium]
MYLFLFHNARLFLRQLSDDCWFPLETCEYHTLANTETFRLTTSDGTTCLAAQVSDETFEGATLWDLRETYGVIPTELHALAGKAAELLFWDKHSRYCSLCGAPMKRHTEISKVCTSCGEEIWPTVQTAVIVLIEHRGKALLVQAKNFRRPFHGLVAGFVETGESLEECVRREVREETGLEICNLRYFDSQPWPYPMGLMVGFRADYAGGTLHLADGELVHADWYTANNLPQLPPPPSIARRLIDTWVAEQLKALQ